MTSIPKLMRAACILLAAAIPLACGSPSADPAPDAPGPMADAPAPGHDAAIPVLPDAAADALVDAAPLDPLGWSPPRAIDDGQGEASLEPRLAVSASGDAMVVWRQRPHVWVRRYTVAGGWEAPEAIARDVATTELAIASNERGDFIVAWNHQQPSQGLSIQRFTREHHWEPVVEAMFHRSAADGIRIAINADGAAAVVWSAYFSGASAPVIHGRAFHPASGWSGPERIGDFTEAKISDVAVDPAGSAVVVWEQGSVTSMALYARRRSADGAWQRAVLLDDSGEVSQPRVVFDRTGAAVAVWVRSETIDGKRVRTRVVSSRLVADTWSSVTELEQADGVPALDPRLLVDTAGRAALVWTTERALAISRLIDGLWEAPHRLAVDSRESLSYYPPHAAASAEGGVAALWRQYDGARWSVWTAVFLSDLGWQPATELSGGVAARMLFPQIGFDAAGHAVALWQQYVAPAPPSVRTPAIVATHFRPSQPPQEQP